MQRLLVVDDEPIIVDGLYELFANHESFELEVYRAYNAASAIAVASRLRIDVLLTDIEMPRMNGIELAEAVKRLWPACKTIFLTGYNNFTYIQSSLRGGALDYVLKTEGDEPIVAAVAKAITLIAEERSYEGLIGKARSQLAAALPTLRKEYLAELLAGEPSTAASRAVRFRELEVPIAAERKVNVIAGRVDGWRDDIQPGDKALFLYAVHNIAEEFLAPQFDVVLLLERQDRFVWLLQPKRQIGETESEPADFYHRVLGIVESIQASCRDFLKLSCSFVVGSEPCDWDGLPDKYDRLRLLFVRGLGLDKEMLLSDRHLFERGGGREDAGKIKRIQLLETYLDQKDAGKFFELFDEITGAVQLASQAGLALEIHHWLGAIFLSYLNRHELVEPLAETIHLGALFTIREHTSWAEVTAYFRRLAELAFAHTQDENDYESDEIVRRVHDFIHGNLEKDLSLNRLAEIVYLAPFYFSRLYKMKTGRSVTDYIAEQRIQKAKQLLRDTDLRILEIGVMLGYHSPPYFTRFFKKATRLTPQEYRDTAKA
ncbi:response regulator [Paenibacillus cymbidii]|uniref:response regulator n=1 Tax=Paenibacillus cymbidii TaxID=1639034 RepID=UPI001436B737|nr:response regulator [Paenibacillus cymbidii]